MTLNESDMFETVIGAQLLGNMSCLYFLICYGWVLRKDLIHRENTNKHSVLIVLLYQQKYHTQMSLVLLFTKLCAYCTLGASGRVVIDHNGDRTSALQFKNIQNGRYHRVFNYFNVEKRLVLLNETVIIWPGGTNQVPLGRPVCGFLGELCITTTGADRKTFSLNFFKTFLYYQNIV